MTLAPGIDAGGPDIVGGSGARLRLQQEQAAGRWQVHTNRDQRADGTRQTRPLTAPATVALGNNAASWAFARPATTICGDSRIGRPGHKDRDRGESAFEHDSYRLSLAEFAILQSFPDDFPFVGTRTAIAGQIGRAVPPPMAEAALRAVRYP